MYKMRLMGLWHYVFVMKNDNKKQVWVSTQQQKHLQTQNKRHDFLSKQTKHYAKIQVSCVLNGKQCGPNMLQILFTLDRKKQHWATKNSMFKMKLASIVVWTNLWWIKTVNIQFCVYSDSINEIVNKST